MRDLLLLLGLVAFVLLGAGSAIWLADVLTKDRP